MSEKYTYSTGEVAKILNVSQTTIFRAIEKKQLKAFTTPGGHYRVSQEDLEELIKRNHIPAVLLEPRTMKVLIVEDNPAELLMFQRSLEDDPQLDVRGTPSGYKAGFLTRSFRPDLILLDIFLGEVDGREIVKLIREDEALRRTKILAVSGTVEPDVIESIKACGVDDFIRKPVTPAELLERVNRLLR